jgi:hypothetical protein
MYNQPRHLLKKSLEVLKIHGFMYVPTYLCMHPLALVKTAPADLGAFGSIQVFCAKRYKDKKSEVQRDINTKNIKSLKTEVQRDINTKRLKS